MAKPQTQQTLENMVTQTGGGQFAFIRGHVTKEGEKRDCKMQIGVTPANLHQRDLETLRSLDPVALAAHPDMVRPLVKGFGERQTPTAEDIRASIDKRIASKIKSINREHPQKETTVVPVEGTKGRLTHNTANPGTVLLAGLEVWASPIEKGTEVKRTETVRNSVVTAVNAWITRRYEVSGKFRKYELQLDGSNFDSLVMGGEVLDRKTIAILVG